MKTTVNYLKNFMGMLCPVLLMGFLFLPVLSCRKNNSATITSLQNAASQLEGSIINGSITAQTDEEGIALWCNDGKILIALALPSSQTRSNPGKIEHGQVLYSDFGIIVRDMDTHQSWYYIQHDVKSRQRFQSLPDAGESPVISGITDLIKINIS